MSRYGKRETAGWVSFLRPAWAPLVLLMICIFVACRPTTTPTTAPEAISPPPTTVTPADTPTPKPSLPPTPEPWSTPTSTVSPVAPAVPVDLPAMVGELWLDDLPNYGRSPEAMVEHDGRIYVASRRDKVVLVIEEDRVADGIALNCEPSALAASSEMGRVYVACQRGNAIQVVEDGRLAATWPIEHTPRALATAGGMLLVGLDSGPGLLVLDADSGVTSSTVSIEPLSAAYWLAVDEISNRLYIAGFEHTLVMDLHSSEISDAGRLHSYLTLATDSTRARWYTNDYDAETNTQWLVAIDGESGQTVGRAPIGSDPRQAVVHPMTGRVYVANSWSNTVSVVDPTDMSLQEVVLVGPQPVALAFDPTGRRLYVANRDSDNLVVIDVASNEIVTTIPLALVPSALSVDAERERLYAIVPAMNALLVFHNQRLEKRLPLDIHPSSLAVDPSTGRIVVGHYVNRSVSMVNPDTWEVESIALSEPPLTSAVDPTRGVIYAGGEVFSARTMSVQRTLEIPTYIHSSTTSPVQIAVDDMADQIFVVAHNGIPGFNAGFIMHAIDAGDGTPLKGTLGGVSTTAMALDSAGRRVYSTAGRMSSYHLYVDDADRLSPLGRLSLDGMPLEMALVPTYHHLYLGLAYTREINASTDMNGELRVLDTRGLGEVRRWALEQPPGPMAADPSSKRVYVSLGSQGRVLIFQDGPQPAPPSPTPSPTLTPWPTGTPTTSPTETWPEATATPCSVSPLLERYWSADLQGILGCPREEIFTFLAEQPFERGRMFWREDRKLIYSLREDGRYHVFDDLWYGGEEYSCQGEPPAKFIMPQRGFGFVWCEAEEVRQRLGWATKEERGYDGAIYEFSKGLAMITDWDAGFLLLDSGEWLGIVPQQP